MFIAKILLFFLYIITACIIFLFLFWIIVFTIRLINSIKILLVWAFLDKIAHIALYPAQKRYRRYIIKTGFSMRSYYRSAPVYHYRYRTVLDGTYRNIIVRFDNNMKVKINIKEGSLLYKKLISAC